MLELGLDAIAAYRLTRLASADVILDRPRAAIIRAAYQWRDGGLRDSDRRQHPRFWNQRAQDDEEAPKLAELVICRWCVGMWISIGVVAARRYAPEAWDPLARALALSAAAALLAGLEAD